MPERSHLHYVADEFSPRSARWAQRSPSGHAEGATRPLLIGACPRSGTTLLRSLLNNHPDLAIPAETDFVLPLWRARVRHGDLRRESNRRELAHWIFHTEGHGGRRIRAKGLAEQDVTRDEAIERVVTAGTTLGSLLAACFAMYANSHGKQRWGDKRPAYAGHVGTLMRLFPDAQFINVVRDPRGAAASLISLGWHRRREATAAAAATWAMSVHRVDQAAKRLRPDQLMDVRYEDLVADPEATLARICTFASLPGGPAIDQMLSADRGGRERFREGWHDKLKQPIGTDPVIAWRDRLRPRQIALVEHAAGSELARWGYRPFDGPTPEPSAAQLTRLRKHVELREAKWAREDRTELKRRIRYRRPVAAR